MNHNTRGKICLIYTTCSYHLCVNYVSNRYNLQSRPWNMQTGMNAAGNSLYVCKWIPINILSTPQSKTPSCESFMSSLNLTHPPAIQTQLCPSHLYIHTHTHIHTHTRKPAHKQSKCAVAPPGVAVALMSSAWTNIQKGKKKKKRFSLLQGNMIHNMMKFLSVRTLFMNRCDAKKRKEVNGPTCSVR